MHAHARTHTRSGHWGEELILTYEGQFQSWPSQNYKRGSNLSLNPFFSNLIMKFIKCQVISSQVFITTVSNLKTPAAW